MKDIKQNSNADDGFVILIVQSEIDEYLPKLSVEATPERDCIDNLSIKWSTKIWKKGKGHQNSPNSYIIL